MKNKAATSDKKTKKLYKHSRASLDKKMLEIYDELDNLDVWETSPNDVQDILQHLNSKFDLLRFDLMLHNTSEDVD